MLRPVDLSAADFPIKRREKAKDFTEVIPISALCAAGKLYEVEAWIAEGRPIQYEPSEDPKLRRRRTPLQITIDAGFYSLTALLLANGYDPNGDYYENLSSAVRAKDHDVVELLLRFGADPNAVDFADVLSTCDRPLMDRFIDVGVDPCAGNAVARALSSKRRPILGFVKQYLERFPGLKRQVDIALHAFTQDEDLKGVSLMLWLGADPYADTPSSAYEDSKYGSVDDNAFERALWSRKPEILARFLRKPIPSGRVNDLIGKVAYRSRPDLVKRLLAEGANPNQVGEEGYHLLEGFVSVLLWRHSPRPPEERERGLEALELMLKAGAKWEMDARKLKNLRRDLVDGESKIVVRLLDLLDKYGALSAEQLHELTRTPAVKRVLNGYSKPYRDPFTVYTPPPVVAPAAQPARGGYWKRHWSQQ